MEQIKISIIDSYAGTFNVNDKLVNINYPPSLLELTKNELEMVTVTCNQLGIPLMKCTSIPYTVRCGDHDWTGRAINEFEAIGKAYVHFTTNSGVIQLSKVLTPTNGSYEYPYYELKSKV